MTAAMIVSELRTLVARRGLFLSSLLIPAGLVILLIILGLILNASDPEYAGGSDFSEGATAFTVFVLIVLSALIGATAGAWDVQNGTFRYLVMTGRSRTAVYLARIPAVLALTVLIVAPAALLTVVASEVMPLGIGTAPTASNHAQAFWAPTIQGWSYGLVAFGVGALLRSVGAAIAVALVLNLVGLQALLLLSLLSEKLGELTLPAVVNRVAGYEDHSLAVSIVALVLWLAAFVAAGAWRTVRAEY